MSSGRDPGENGSAQRPAAGVRVRHVVAVLAGLVGIVAGSIAVIDHFGNGSTPAFAGNVTEASAARKLQKFLVAHDGKVVRLSVECDVYERDKWPENKSCAAGMETNYSRASRRALWVWTFPNGQGSPYATQMRTWFPEEPAGSSAFAAANNGDTSSGVGGILAKGYFAVVITGTGSLGPTGLKVAELRPVLQP